MTEPVLGQAMALLCAVFWALAIILLRRSGGQLPAFEINLFKNCLGLLLVFPTAWLVHGLDWSAYQAEEIVITLVSGLIGIALADTWYLKALGIMGASRTGIVASAYSPFVIILSVLLLGESLAGWQFLGLALVMSGILLVTWRQNRAEITLRQVRIGTLYAAGAVFMMATGVVMVKEVLESRPLLWTASLRLLGGVAGMMVYAVLFKNISTITHNFRRPQPWVGLVAGSFLASYVSMMLWLGGYRLIPASEASILNETASVWIVFFAWLILHERISPRKLLGLLITFSGVGVMLAV